MKIIINQFLLITLLLVSKTVVAQNTEIINQREGFIF